MVGAEPNPLVSDIYRMIMTLGTIVFEVRSFTLFPALFKTPFTHPTAVYREGGVLG